MSSFHRIASGQNASLSAKMLRALGWVASKPYQVAMRLRNVGYDRGVLKSQKVSAVVIAIGNITVGGTGKTPTVAMLCRRIRAMNLRVAIVSRGYKSADNQRNDEAIELERMLPDVPHIQNPDRVLAAQTAIEEFETQVIVMDDGFQHRRLQRDLDIVLLDATEPFGYGHLLPRGLLREPISAIKRAAIVIVTRADQVDQQRLADLRKVVQRLNSKSVWVEAVHQPQRLKNIEDQTQPLQSIVDRPCFLVCGIGNPAAFEKTVLQAGGRVVKEHVFPDHHCFTSADIAQLESEVSDIAKQCGSSLVVLCTGKDLSKLNVTSIGGCELYAVEIQLELISGSEALDDRLTDTLSTIGESIQGRMTE